ncbi:MAG TPA: hypothetical protein VGF94_24830 [Kofleriaceae bacterium]|jgi:hypothetical protein
MAGAVRLQEQRACIARRVLSTIASLWLVAYGVLGARHEAHVAHVVDARTGAIFHGSAIDGNHTSDQSDVHRSKGTPDHDACVLASTLHQPASPAVARPHVAPSPVTALAQAAPIARTALATRATYRTAPKTSPPVAA